MKFLGAFKPFFDQVQVGLRRGNTLFRLLLKDVQHVYSFDKSHGVHRTISIAPIVLDDLKNRRTAKTMKWLGFGVLLADLSQIERVAKNILHRRRQGLRILF